MSPPRRSNITLFDRTYGVPEYIARTSYDEIFDATFGTVSEGFCPNCSARVPGDAISLEAGRCPPCQLRWQAQASGDEAMVVVYTAKSCLTWHRRPVIWKVPPSPSREV